MQAMTVSAKLDDPGIGLRDNGRRVLCYADLKSTFADPDGRAPGREIELHLTGHMERFAWSFNGRKFMDAEPLRLNYGERMRITLVNDTMMTRSEEHTSELQSLMRISYAVFCLKKKNNQYNTQRTYSTYSQQ